MIADARSLVYRMMTLRGPRRDPEFIERDHLVP